MPEPRFKAGDTVHTIDNATGTILGGYRTTAGYEYEVRRVWFVTGTGRKMSSCYYAEKELRPDQESGGNSDAGEEGGL